MRSHTLLILAPALLCLALAPARLSADAQPGALSPAASAGLPSPLSPSAGGFLVGRVLKLGSPDPVSGATVALLGLSATAISGADGGYRLAAPAGRFSLQISADGFAAKVVKVRRGPAAGGELKQDLWLSSQAYTAEALKKAGDWSDMSARFQRQHLNDPSQAAALSTPAGAALSPTARLHGRVLKLGSPDPVPGATVQLMGLSITVSSDAQGEYRLDFPGGPFQLRAYADGFAARIYKVKKGPEAGEDARLNLSLDSTVFEAGQITVKGHRDRPQVLTTTLSHDEIKRIPGTGGDALRAVQNLPGVAIPSDFSGQISVEGNGPNDNLYLIDNVPWPFPFHLGGIVSTVSSDILDSVDLNSAGFGARWGNSLGSVLEGKTAPGQADRLHVDADISLIMSQLTLQGPLGLGNATFTLAGRRSYLDLVLSHLDSSNFTALPVFWDGGATLDWHWGPDNHFRALALTNDDTLGVVLAAKDAPSAQLAGEFRLHNAATTSGLVWTNTALAHFRSVFTPYLYRVDLDDSLGTGFEIDNHDDVYGFKEEATWNVSPDQEWSFGGGASIVDESTHEYFYTRDFNNLGAASPTAASTTVSAQSLVRYAFVQDRVQLAGPLALTLGLRYDKSGKVADDALNPRLALELKSPGGLLWKAAWGLYSQFPTAIQLDPQFGNPGLVAERAQHTMLSVEKDLGMGRLIRLDGYYKSFNDLVVDLQPTTYTSATTNGQAGQAEGFELLLRQNIGQRFFGWVSYSWCNTVRLDPGYDWAPYQYDQSNILTLVASYLLTPAWGAGLKLHYNTGPLVQSTTVDHSVSPPLLVYSHTYDQRLDDYTRLDLRTDYTWRFPDWHLTAYFEIWNVLNRPNPEGLSYDPKDATKAPATVDNLPRFPFVGMEAAY